MQEFENFKHTKTTKLIIDIFTYEEKSHLFCNIIQNITFLFALAKENMKPGVFSAKD